MGMSHNGQFQRSEFSDEPTVSPELRQLTMATCASNLVRSLHTHKVPIRSHGGTRVGVTTPLLGRMYNCDWFQEPRSKTISCRKSQMQSAACQHPRFQAIYAPHQGQRSSGAVFTNAHLVTSHPSTYGQDVLLCASFMKKDFKSVEVNRIQDCGQILNLCSPGAAYAASPQ